LTRFVVLRHFWPDGDGSKDHFDLMIEDPDRIDPRYRLATWRLSEWPVRRRSRIVRSADHRVEWLELEGPVSGGRGIVTRSCWGLCMLTSRSSDCWRVRIVRVDAADGEALCRNDSGTSDELVIKQRIGANSVRARSAAGWEITPG
jgi:hypothetical protein